MAVKFFGQFLVEHGAVSSESLIKAIELQEANNLKLGEMAMDMGLITQSDIDRAHNAQMSKDLKLGDMLVEMGIITIEQLNDVVTRQKNTHLYIGEALVQVGALTTTALQQQLDAFKEDQAKYATNGIEMPLALPHQNIWEMTADLTYKMITRVLDLQFRPGKCTVATCIPTNTGMAAMDFSGDVEARYLVSVSEKLRKTIAKAILSEENVDNEPLEVLEDTVMEFVNVVCGNVAAKASQMGVVMHINPPCTLQVDADGLQIPAGHTVLDFPVYIGDGDLLSLYLLIKN